MHAAAWKTNVCKTRRLGHGRLAPGSTIVPPRKPANHPARFTTVTHRKEFRDNDQNRERKRERRVHTHTHVHTGGRVAFHASRIADALDYISIMVIVNLSGAGGGGGGGR